MRRCALPAEAEAPGYAASAIGTGLTAVAMHSQPSALPGPTCICSMVYGGLRATPWPWCTLRQEARGKPGREQGRVTAGCLARQPYRRAAEPRQSPPTLAARPPEDVRRNLLVQVCIGLINHDVQQVKPA